MLIAIQHTRKRHTDTCKWHIHEVHITHHNIVGIWCLLNMHKVAHRSNLIGVFSSALTLDCRLGQRQGKIVECEAITIGINAEQSRIIRISVHNIHHIEIATQCVVLSQFQQCLAIGATYEQAVACLFLAFDERSIFVDIIGVKEMRIQHRSRDPYIGCLHFLSKVDGIIVIHFAFVGKPCYTLLYRTISQHIALKK